MLFAVKNGGHIIFSAQFSFLGNFKYSDYLEELEKAGRIKFVEASVFYRYEAMKQGVGKYIKTPAKVYVYRKTEGDSILASSAYKKKST
jgi:hypothetical protein